MSAVCGPTSAQCGRGLPNEMALSARHVGCRLSTAQQCIRRTLTVLTRIVSRLTTFSFSVVHIFYHSTQSALPPFPLISSVLPLLFTYSSCPSHSTVSSVSSQSVFCVYGAVPSLLLASHTAPARAVCCLCSFVCSAGLFGCFDDIGICLTTCVCPCVQYGLNQDRLHPGVREQPIAAHELSSAHPHNTTH